MSWFSLNEPFGSDYAVDPQDIVNTKTALNQLDYYDPPEGIGIQPWTDNAVFDGIKQFQKDNKLEVDGYMRPGGPTEERINYHLAKNTADGEDNQEKDIQPGMPKGSMSNMPVVVPAWNPDPKMYELKGNKYWEDGPYTDEKGTKIFEGYDKNTRKYYRGPRDI